MFLPDYHLISSCNIGPESHIKVMRIKEMITNKSLLIRLLIVKQILLVSTSGNVWRAVRRVWKLMIGCEGLRTPAYVINIF